MANLVENLPDIQDKDFQIDLNWKSSPSAKKLLDTIVSILAEEYYRNSKTKSRDFYKIGGFL